MKYTMFHNRFPTITFRTDDYGYVTEVLSVQNERHVHPFLLVNGKVPEEDNYYPLYDSILRWMLDRNIPASRKNLSSALSALGVGSASELSEKSFFLSLTDHYWIAPADANLDWKRINFFTNSFSEDVGKSLFGNPPKKTNLNLHSPDSNTDGALVKKWIIEDEERVLVKGGSGTEQLEPFNEVLASEVCGRLGIEHCEYTLYFEDRKHFSKCKDMSDENTELLTAGEICEDLLSRKDGSVPYGKFKERCSLLGIKLDEMKLGNMFIMDYLIANEDRHLNNFGFLRDVNTLEWKGLAPVYDSGNSMFYKLNDFEITEDIGLCADKLQCKPFNDSFILQLSLVPFRKCLDSLNLSSLNGIDKYYKELLHENVRNVSEDKIAVLSNSLKNRLEMLKEISRARTFRELSAVQEFNSLLLSKEKSLQKKADMKEIKECYSEVAEKKGSYKEQLAFYLDSLNIHNKEQFADKVLKNEEAMALGFQKSKKKPESPDPAGSFGR